MDNTKILTEAQIKAIEEVAELVKQAVEWIVKALKALAQVVVDLWRTVIANYQNRRVVHLALHHKDLRVRKKNGHRIMRWLRRYIKCRE